ncbi:MAG: CoA transferase [Sphingomonas bacterium]|nr:CoA transferase [Sphingomonas bacterium]
MRSGPLRQIRIVEFAGIGPTPFAAMMLADMGADVIRIDRPGGPAVSAGPPTFDILNRSRRSIALDLKHPASVEIALRLCASADVVLEGFRPGVMERLGFGPDQLRAEHPALVYARMTGWGQTGRFADKAGHDINYMAQSGALGLIGDANSPPVPPLNFVADFGGGATFVVVGILAALVERQSSGEGQVVDAAMIDGSALLTAQVHGWRTMGFWEDRRSSNLLDGAAYFYRCYETADGGYLAVGAIEPQFHAAFITGLGLSINEFDHQLDRTLWSERARQIASIIRADTRDTWVERFAPLDACVTPVLSLDEASRHPANVERNLFGAPQGLLQPMPAPRFDRTPASTGRPPCAPGTDGERIMTALTSGIGWPPITSESTVD